MYELLHKKEHVIIRVATSNISLLLCLACGIYQKKYIANNKYIPTQTHIYTNTK